MQLFVDRQFASPWAMAVFVGLREKGLDFELAVLDLAHGEQHQASFSQLSLTQRIPTLVDGEFSLSESTAILEYLDDRQPEPALLPRALHDRARARQVQAWLRSDLVALRAERSTEVVFYRPTHQPLTAAGQAAADKLIAVASKLLGDREHLFGAWSIVDVDLAITLNRLVLNGDPVPAALRRYATRQWQRPAVQAWVQLERPAL